MRDGFADKRSIVERAAQIHIKHAQYPSFPRELHRSSNRRTRHRTPLPESAEVDRVRLGDLHFQRICPIDKIPRRTSMNLKARLSRRIHIHADAACYRIGNTLHQIDFDAESPQNCDRLVAAYVFSDGTEHRHVATEERRVAGEIRGCATETGAFGKEVPQHFTAREDAWFARLSGHGELYRATPHRGSRGRGRPSACSSRRW